MPDSNPIAKIQLFQLLMGFFLRFSPLQNCFLAFGFSLLQKCLILNTLCCSHNVTPIRGKLHERLLLLLLFAHEAVTAHA